MLIMNCVLNIIKTVKKRRRAPDTFPNAARTVPKKTSDAGRGLYPSCRSCRPAYNTTPGAACQVFFKILEDLKPWQAKQ